MSKAGVPVYMSFKGVVPHLKYPPRVSFLTLPSINLPSSFPSTSAPMSRSRLPSRLAIWQLACRVLSFIADTIIFAIFLWSSIRSHYFSIPAYIGLGFAYLIDVEEILALTNKKRTIRRWWTLWIIFLDLLAAGLFWAGPFSLIQWPAVPKPDRNLPPSEVAPHDDQLPLVIAFFTGL